MTGMATKAQIDFICDLMDSRNLFADPGFFDACNAMDAGEYDAYIAKIKSSLPAISKQRASDIITKLKALPKKDTPTATATKSWEPVGQPSEPGKEVYAMFKQDAYGNDLFVPRGSYVIDHPTGYTNEIGFYSVWIDKREGEIRWSVKMYVSDELVRLPRKRQYEVLEAIASDPLRAASRYGLETKRCGICHRKLTKDESRERGIGPVCAERFGW